MYYKNVIKELSLIEEKIEALQDEYRLKIKAFAGDPKTSSIDLEQIYSDHLMSSYSEGLDGDIGYVHYLAYDLDKELSKNINTPEYILNEIRDLISSSYEVVNNAEETLARQSLLIAKNINSTDEALHNLYYWLDETYIAVSKHHNASSNTLEKLIDLENMDVYMNIAKHHNATGKILDKISCIYDEVDELILKHNKTYKRTKNKINKKSI